MEGFKLATVVDREADFGMARMYELRRADDGSILDAVNLNNLEDWNDFHGATVA